MEKMLTRNIKPYFQTFDYVLFLHMMMIILALTSGLSKTFQTKDLDIVNAIYVESLLSGS
jgi:hypothetical protein